MHKPSYGVVTSVVAVLTCIGFTSHYLIDLIPPGAPNDLISERAEFLQQAAYEQIDWQPLSEQTFADASKQEKPIMLVVGSACSLSGRAIDKFVFSANDVRGFLDRNFICARLDTMAQPEFLNAFLPVSRALPVILGATKDTPTEITTGVDCGLLPQDDGKDANRVWIQGVGGVPDGYYYAKVGSGRWFRTRRPNTFALYADVGDTQPIASTGIVSESALMQGPRRPGIPPDCQVWFLDPKGRLIGYTAETEQGQSLDPTAFLGALTAASDRFDDEQDGKEEGGLAQERDIEAIDAPVASRIPDPHAFADYLSNAASSDEGGFPVDGFQRLWPSAWEFELAAGRNADYLRSIAPCLSSPDVDLLDGGFYTDAATMDWHGIGYDKLAVTNAAMMETLALGALLTHDPEQERVALATFDWLINSRSSDGLIPAGQIGDEDSLGRSLRSSFPPRVLRDLFPSDADREWVRNAFGLRVETDPQMTPMIANPLLKARNPDRFAADLAKMRANRPVPKFAGYAQLDVGGFAAARMLRVARLLGDRGRLTEAERLFEKLDDFRSLDDVVHSRAPEAQPHSYLGDYLAYADGALQYFLATGNSAAFENGLAVLQRGLVLYGGTVKGVYSLSEPPKKLAPQGTAVPEIVDNVRESCSAQIIRLCNDYGRLLTDRGEDLRTAAGATLFRFAPLASGLGQYAGGYYCAALGMENSGYAVANGPDAVALASRLARRVPTALVAPAVGPVKAPGREPGFYIVRADSVEGPLSLDKAAAALQRPSF